MTTSKAKNQARRASRNDEIANSDQGVALAELESIFDKLRALLALEYDRGTAHAASRIMSIVSANESRPDFRTSDVRPITRAPRGAAQQLVEKALADGPKTIREIRETARTEVERFLSYQTVRLELERGKVRKKYKKTKDKWSLS